MSVITITSDWGTSNHYLASVKGAILSKLPDVRIVDISHEIKAFDLEETAFVLKNAYHFFPEGSIHLIGVQSEETKDIAHVVVKHNGHYFIGSDNGIFSFLFDEIPEIIYELDIPLESNSFTFSSRDRFVKAAAHLIKGGQIEKLGNKVNEINKKFLVEPVVEVDLIKGHVIYIDRYENLITNISKSLFNKVKGNSKFSIVFRRNTINKISDSYLEGNSGDILAIFNSNDYLEIAMNQGNAAGLLGLKLKSLIRIEFFSK